MSTLRLYFLGTLDIRYDGQELPKPPTLKSQSLLAYLILHRDQPQPRDRLVDLFWGDRPEAKARRRTSRHCVTLRPLRLGPRRSAAQTAR